MNSGQIVRIKPASPIAVDAGITGDAAGEVLCSYYRTTGPEGEIERLDVRFDDGLVLWGVPASEFVVHAGGAAVDGGRDCL